MVCKIVFCSEFPDIPDNAEKRHEKEKKEKKNTGNWVSHKRNKSS